jgi:hypothetical protein
MISMIIRIIIKIYENIILKKNYIIKEKNFIK